MFHLINAELNATITVYIFKHTLLCCLLCIIITVKQFSCSYRHLNSLSLSFSCNLTKPIASYSIAISFRNLFSLYTHPVPQIKGLVLCFINMKQEFVGVHSTVQGTAKGPPRLLSSGYQGLFPRCKMSWL
jgi:hypothetical protein